MSLFIDGVEIRTPIDKFFEVDVLDVRRDDRHPSARFPFAYIHERCGYPAFYLRHHIPYGSDLRSKDAATLDGEPMRPYSPCTCGHCGEQLPMPPGTNHIQELLPS